MAIIKEIEHGECRLHICDDYIRSDPEEIQKIIDNVKVIAHAILTNKERAKGEKEVSA